MRPVWVAHPILQGGGAGNAVNDCGRGPRRVAVPALLCVSASFITSFCNKPGAWQVSVSELCEPSSELTKSEEPGGPCDLRVWGISWDPQARGTHGRCPGEPPGVGAPPRWAALRLRPACGREGHSRRVARVPEAYLAQAGDHRGVLRPVRQGFNPMSTQSG